MTTPANVPRGITVRERSKRLDDGTIRTERRYRARVTWTHTDPKTGEYVTERVELGEFRTLGDAKAAHSIATGQVTSGTFVPPTVRRRLAKASKAEAEARRERVEYTAGQWVDEWVCMIREGDYSANTKRTYVSGIQAFKEAFNDTPLVSITPEAMDAWLHSLTTCTRISGGKTKTVKRAWQSVKNTRTRTGTCLAAAVSVGKISAVPMPEQKRNTRTAKMNAKPTRRKLDYVPTPEQIATAVDYAVPAVGAAIMICYYTGLRPGEIRALQRRHVITGGDNPRICVEQAWSRGEGGHETLGPCKSEAAIREIPLDTHTAAWLREYMRTNVAPNATAWMIPAPDNRERAITERKLTEGKHRWKTARGVAGIPEQIRFYDLRAACLTRLGYEGATLDEIMRFGGHTDVQAAMRYQRSTTERLRALVDRREAPAPLADIVQLERAE